MSETPELEFLVFPPDCDARLESLALRNRMDAFVLTQMEGVMVVSEKVEAVQLAILETELEERRLRNQLLAIQVERERAELLRSIRKNDRVGE